jgi:hypothetical protein
MQELAAHADDIRVDAGKRFEKAGLTEIGEGRSAGETREVGHCDGASMTSMGRFVHCRRSGVRRREDPDYNRKCLEIGRAPRRERPPMPLAGLRRRAARCIEMSAGRKIRVFFSNPVQRRPPLVRTIAASGAARA